MITEPSTIEVWFDFGSNYSYLSVVRIEDAGREKGVPIIWKAFLLGPIFRGLGETLPSCCRKRRAHMFGATWSGSVANLGCVGGNPALFRESVFFLCA